MSYYGAPPRFGAGAPPGMGGPPGMAGSPPGMPSQFRAPPDLDFSAPVIRLGMDSQPKPYSPADKYGGDRGGRGSNAEPLGNRSRMGLGSGRDYGDRNLDAQRAAVRESMQVMNPPTKEEVSRTIFIGGIGEGAPDDDKIEQVLRCAGKLRRWTRVRDADDKKCKFGFAEYEDVDSLDAANVIFGEGIEVPVFDKTGQVAREEEGGEVKKMKLLAVVDEQSKEYITKWKGKQAEAEEKRQFRLDTAREDLQANFTAMVNQAAFGANALNGQNSGADGDMSMTDAFAGNANVVTIPVELEDELADLPENIRATVAMEIKAFRDRSKKRDLESFRQEEEAMGAARYHRERSPNLNGSSSNGIPSGPRDRSGVQGAPSGPKGFRGAQLPSDYVNGVNFVSNGTNGHPYGREDDDAEESDEELERRRQAKREADAAKQYKIAEARWQSREQNRQRAHERQRARDAAEKRDMEKRKDGLAAALREFDDDEVERNMADEYYYDHSAWLRKRTIFREGEQRVDDQDRADEQRQLAEEKRREAEAKGMADDFLNSIDVDLGSNKVGTPNELPRRHDQAGGLGGFKISLGAAAQRAQAKPSDRPGPSRRAMADVENLLEDEDDAAAAGRKKPVLKPLDPTSAADDDVQDAKSLAASLPTSTEDVFAFPIQWKLLSPSLLDERVRPSVEKRVVESLGVQEDLVVDTVMQALKDRKEAKWLVGELEEVLEDEAGELVRKVWRLVEFLTECEARGFDV